MKGGEGHVTKIELLRENEELRAALETIRAQVSELLDDEEDCDDLNEGEEEEPEDAEDEEA